MSASNAPCHSTPTPLSAANVNVPLCDSKLLLSAGNTENVMYVLSVRLLLLLIRNVTGVDTAASGRRARRR